MTYNVFGGTLSLTQSITVDCMRGTVVALAEVCGRAQPCLAC